MARSLARLLVHPSLWTTAVRLGWRLRLFPDPAYMKFRMVTMYGDAEALPRAEDLITYLRWCKAWGRPR
ncbi:MAG: hypothetical protein OXT07_09290 [bacterium]|nr:hypothetical protein [bacterium]MDE0216491.1 hypothetical protein [bacterium]